MLELGSLTRQEVIILIVLYAFAITGMIQSARLWLAQRHIRYLIKQNPTIAREKATTKPMIFDQSKSVPKASDDRMPMSIPPTIAPPIVYSTLAIVKRFYQRIKHLVNHNREEPNYLVE